MKMFRWMIPMVAVAFGLIACGMTTARGQVAVVSVKSTGELISGAKALVTATGGKDPQGQAALAFLDQLKGPEMLKGLDLSKPLGGYSSIPANGGEPPYGVIMVPITAQADFLAMLERFGIQVSPKAGVDGVTHQIIAPGAAVPLMGRFEDGYAVFTTRPTGPPTDAAMKPATVLGKPSSLLSARVRFDQMSEPTKQQINGFFDQQVAAEGPAKPGEDEDSREARLAGMNLVYDGLRAMLRDGRDMVLSVDADSKNGNLSLEIAANPKPSTPMVKTFQEFGATPSLFQGIGSKGIVNLAARVPLSESIRKLYAGLTNKAREKAAQGQADPEDKALLNEVFDIFEPILTAPDFDLGFAGFGPFPAIKDGPPTYAALYGLKVKDGARVDKLLRDLAKKAAKEMPPGIEKITLDAAKANDGVTPIHEIRLKGGNPSLATMGDPVFQIAVRRDALLIGLGGSAPLKMALDAMSKPASGTAKTTTTPPIQVAANVGKLVLFGSAVSSPGGDANIQQMFQANGIFQGADAARDLVSLTIGGGNALTVRLKIDGPILKLLYSAGVNH